MYLGHFQTNLDLEKGRTALPSTFRKQIGKQAIITKGYEQSLLLIKRSDWDAVVGQTIPANFLSAFNRQTERFLLGNAFEIRFDIQGRFIVPAKLRDFAKLGKQILFVGVGNRIEVWDEDLWEKQDQYITEHIAQISEKLDDQIRKPD